MNIENATDARDLVLTCYICDDQYTGDRIELHIKEWENDWNYEEIDKPVNERIPLPKPTREFLKLFEKAKELFQSKIEFYDNESSKEETDNETSEEDEEEEEESEEEPEEMSEKENKQESSDKPPKLTHNESDSNIENSLIPCPNCKRTFFADRLTIHLKSCKPGKSMGGTQRKKPAYQPPKLKNKKTWKPPSDHESDEEKINHNKDVEEKGYTNSNKSKRKAPGRLTTYDKFDKEGLPSDTKASQDLSSTKKSMKKPKGQKELTTNTVTTFSRMEEDPEQRNSEFNDIYGAAEEDSRVPCKNCGRKFNPDRLPIHQKSCNNMKKRSVFNSQKKRAADGTMGIPGQKKQQPKKKAKKEQPLGKKAKWKRDHEDLVKAIKMSRMIKKVQDEGGDITKIPVAPPSKNEDYVEWQYWYRRYAPMVAERHIPKWKTMINRPKPPPHILKRLKEEEERKKAKKAKRKKFHNQTYYKDTKNMTANNFVKDLNPETKSESHHTQYPFKPTLNKIKEENEDNEQPYASGKKPPRHLDFHPKRGKSVINKAMNSNGFSRSGINNSTSYQSNFNDAAFSTSSSKNFLNSPHHSTIESRKAAKRADSLVARSATYSNVPCPHWDRKFSQAAAERHVPICQSIIAKPIGLRKSSSKRTSVQLPHLSQTSYKQGGFESSLMNNTSSTFRSTEGKFHKNFQNAGLPPTHKSSAKSAGLGRAKNNFQIKRAFCSCCGDKFRNRDKFCSSCGEKRII